ncbi:hypothetical protein H8F21_14035 [Pseudomonas sp. P66]|uniref:Uncharacterized protein n=1 Tax=Pseudomonas arcuscaelestis TaxID=2710591 RepID=A0ABS2BYI9_9PSED|nr:hypothetical protein [Pseudomonas arcuscaelestis]MBM5458684.1 hypothetical protein [Pseudomonas arcuscaelestis]
MAWIKPQERYPTVGKPVVCRLRHCTTGATLESRLIKVDESDCTWRVADDGYELSYDWDVVEWADHIHAPAQVSPRPAEVPLESPIQVGKAILADNTLTYAGTVIEIRSSAEFAAYARNTAAVVSTALARIFDELTGELWLGENQSWELDVTGVAPWQQYSAAVQLLDEAPVHADVVAGWCALLCLHQRFLPANGVEPKAIAFAAYLASKAYKAAHASPDAVRAWDEYQAWATSTEGVIASMDGSGPREPTPWEGAVPSLLPTPVSLRHLTALDLANAYGCDTIVKGGQAFSCFSQYHSIQCVDNVTTDERLTGKGPGHFSVMLQHLGTERQFRVSVEGECFTLRPMANNPPGLE